jgi:hypothetical protein
MEQLFESEDKFFSLSLSMADPEQADEHRPNSINPEITPCLNPTPLPSLDNQLRMAARGLQSIAGPTWTSFKGGD